MNAIRKHLTYANVVSSICLFLLLGGGAALAAGKLAKNTVGTNQLKKNAVTAAKIKNGAITSGKLAAGAVTLAKLGTNSVDSSKVVDKSLTGQDVAPDSLTGDNINESTLGEVPNATKLAGKTATQFTSSDIYKAESVVGPGDTIGDGTQVMAESCNPGDILLSGGPANIAATTTLLESFPSPLGTNTWSVRVNKNGQTDNFNVVVLCARQT